MVVVVTNVLQIPLPKFHDGNDAIIHIGKLAKICVTNGEDILHINYNIFLQHYKEKMRIGLLVMRQQTLLQLGERFSVHLFQNLVMCVARNKP